MSDKNIVSRETKSVTESFVKFVNRVIIPIEEKHRDIVFDERVRYQPNGRLITKMLELRLKVRMASAEAGFYTMFGSADLGGGGLGAVDAAYFYEKVNRAFGIRHPLLHEIAVPSPFTNGLSPILETLSQELKDKYIEDIGRGIKTLCFALSEPDAGSDVYAIRTKASFKNGEWVIRGNKQWITNSPYADYAMIFAITNDEKFGRRKGGITGFFVDTKAKGFNVTSIIPIMGHVSADIGIISLDDVRVPEENILGDVDGGFDVAIRGINKGRLGMAGKGLGLAEWALDKAVDYALHRKTFGVTIGRHQAVQMLLADSAIDIYALKQMVYDCAERVDAGEPAIKEISMVKAFGTEVLQRVMDRAIQVHGAMGLTNEVGLEEGFRYGRIMRIPDGTGEIQRRTIARRLLRGDMDF